MSKPNRPKIGIENVNHPGQLTNVDAEKYQAMKLVLLKVIPDGEPGLTQAEMFEAILPHLPDPLWPGGAKSGWWAKSVQLDLEAKGQLSRSTTKPLRWFKP